MKYTYIVITAAQQKTSLFSDEPEDPKKYVYSEVQKFSYSDNIARYLENIGGLISANIAPSKKIADEIAASNNETWKRNGIYLFA